MLLKGKKYRYTLALVLCALLLGIGYLRSGRGLDLSDEGAYVSIPMRYVLGDVPFRDEIVDAQRPAYLLVSLLFVGKPDISLLQIRLWGAAISAIGIIMIYLFICWYTKPFLAVFLCITMFLINNFFGILSPSYNLLSSNFLLIALSLWFFSMEAVNKLKIILSSMSAGLFLSLAVISYPTTFLVISVPLFFLFVIFIPTKKFKQLVYPTVLLLLWFLFFMGIVFICFYLSGLLPDFIRSNKLVLATTLIGTKGPILKLANSMIKLWHYHLSPLLAGGMLFLIFLFRIPQEKRFRIFFPIFSLVALTAMPLLLSLINQNATDHGGMFNVRIELFYFMTLFTGVILLMVLLFGGKYEPEISGKLDWYLVRNLLTGWSLVLAFIYAVSSSSGASSIMGIMPLFLISMVSLYKIITSRSGITPSGSLIRNAERFMFGALVAVFVLTGIIYNVRYVIYSETDLSRLDYQFKHPKLIGIRSSREKGKSVEELLAYLDKRVKPGSYFLAYNYIPMLYFLTHTRPAYGTVWMTDSWPVSIHEQLLNKMITNNRIPEYCVRVLVTPQDWKTPMVYNENFSIDIYVKNNYYLEKTIYPFEVWHRQRTNDGLI